MKRIKLLVIKNSFYFIMYLKSINFNQICLKIVYFIINLLILILLCFIGVYFFFESSNRQIKHVEKDILLYKSVLNQQYVIKNKIDTLYYNMRLLNTGKVQNDHVLERYISKQIEEIKNLINKDKEENFNSYALLLKQVDSMLMLKGQLIQINSQENLTLKDLNECMSRFKNVYTQLNEDPHRK